MVDGIRLNALALRRLARLQARMEGANLVAQAAIDVARRLNVEMQQTLTEECAEAGMNIPEGDQSSPVDIDWRTGDVRLRTGDAQADGVAVQAPPRPAF